MVEPSPAILAAALDHARAEDPRESCGLVVAGTYQPCRNIATGPDTFIIAPDDYLRAATAGPVEMIVHSHPSSSPHPSATDRVACDASAVPWLIVQPRLGTHATLSPSTAPLPLLGRPWVWGAADCWGLVRDWHHLTHGVVLPDYQRPDTPEEFQAAPLFDQIWPSFGFQQLDPGDPLTPGTVALMSIGGPGLNHVGVIVENGQILHHLRGRLSCREIYGGWLQKCTGRLVRYKDLPR